MSTRGFCLFAAYFPNLLTSWMIPADPGKVDLPFEYNWINNFQFSFPVFRFNFLIQAGPHNLGPHNGSLIKLSNLLVHDKDIKTMLNTIELHGRFDKLIAHIWLAVWDGSLLSKFSLRQPSAVHSFVLHHGPLLTDGQSCGGATWRLTTRRRLSCT